MLISVSSGSSSPNARSLIGLQLAVREVQDQRGVPLNLMQNINMIVPHEFLYLRHKWS
jgi:hypothetical protein